MKSSYKRPKLILTDTNTARPLKKRKFIPPAFHDQIYNRNKIEVQNYTENKNSLLAQMRIELAASKQSVEKHIASNSRYLNRNTSSIAQPNYALPSQTENEKPLGSMAKRVSTSILPSVTQINGTCKKRIKSFDVKFLKKWGDLVESAAIKEDSLVATRLEFQSKYLIDETNVLLENIQHFKSNFLNNSTILYIFDSINVDYKEKINVTLEETCGLLLQLSKLLLMDFAEYLERFVSIQLPTADKLKKQEVKDETNTFKANCQIFAEVSLYFKGCFEVYNLLIKQIDDLILPRSTFLKVSQFLARSRLNVSTLVFSAKGITDNYRKDEEQGILIISIQVQERASENSKSQNGWRDRSYGCSWWNYKLGVIF